MEYGCVCVCVGGGFVVLSVGRTTAFTVTFNSAHL